MWRYCIEVLPVAHTILSIRMPTAGATVAFFLHNLLGVLIIGHTPIPITVPSTRTATAKFGINGFGVLAIGHTILSIIVIAAGATGIRTHH